MAIMTKKNLLKAVVGLLFLSILCFSKPTLAAQIIKTDATKSYVVLNKNTNFLNQKNQKSKKTAAQGKGYRIYYLKTVASQLYYGTKQKMWLPAKMTHGTVWYSENSTNMMVLTTSKKGRLSYSLYEIAQKQPLVVIHNAYVYNNQGLLAKNKNNALTVLKKGQKLVAYTTSQVNGNKFYVTNRGWIKVRNAQVKQLTKQTKSKKFAKKSKNI